MILKLYTILDTLAHEFGPPYLSKNDEVAARAFRSTIKQLSTGVNKDEYELYWIGIWDTEKAKITSRPASKIFLADDPNAVQSTDIMQRNQSIFHKETELKEVKNEA